MTKRVLLAGLLGGFAMFLWSGLAHNVLPLGEVGVQEIPNESGVLAAMHGSMRETSGLYLFPGTGAGPNASRQQKREAMKNYQAKLDTNPSGLVIYNPPGSRVLSPRLLVTEFLTELIEALIVVFLLAQTRLSTFASRVGFVLLAGILAAITTNMSYWNWYGFPGNYTAAYMFVEIVGYLVVGVVAALVLGKSDPARLSAAV
jgi:hypothetical protein